MHQTQASSDFGLIRHRASVPFSAAVPSVPPCRLRRLLTGSVVPLLAVGCAYLLIPAFGHAIWYDESYSVALTSHGWGGIWNLGSLDVHPIGYYMLLNLVRLVFGEHVVAYRLMSAAASCALVVAGYAMMRRGWGARRMAVRGVGVLRPAVHAHGVPDPHVLMGGAGRHDVLPVRDAHLHQGARQWARARDRVDRIRAVLPRRRVPALLCGARRDHHQCDRARRRMRTCRGSRRCCRRCAVCRRGIGFVSSSQ